MGRMEGKTLSPTSSQTLLNYREAAEALRVSEITLRRWVSQKRIPHIKLGYTVRFDPEELRQYVRRHSVQPREVRQ